MNSLNLSEEIGELCSENCSMPFLGACGSKQILNCDWDILMNEMAAQYNITEIGNMKIAQRFIDTYGKSQFCNFLTSKFSLNNFDDDKGYIYLTISSMARHYSRLRCIMKVIRYFKMRRAQEEKIRVALQCIQRRLDYSQTSEQYQIAYQ